MTQLHAGHSVHGTYTDTVQREKVMPDGEKRTQYRLVIAGQSGGWDGDGSIRIGVPHGQPVPQLEAGQFYVFPVTHFSPSGSDKTFYTLDPSRPIEKHSGDLEQSQAA